MALRWKYGLRVSGLIVTILCGILAYVGNARREYHRLHRVEIDALDRFQRRGGVLFYATPLKELVASASWEAWVRGERHIGEICGVYIGPKCEPTVFDSLQGLRTLHITSVYIDNVRVSSGILSSGLMHLGCLEKVRMTRCTVTGDDWGQLRKLRRLWHVRLEDSNVNGSGLVAIAGIPTLKVLCFEGMKIDEDVCRNISGNTAIVDLGFSRSKVTDEGVVEVAKMHTLRRLDLSQTACSDGIIDRLVLMPLLEWVGTDGSGFTPSGIERLNDAGIGTGPLVLELSESLKRSDTTRD